MSNFNGYYLTEKWFSFMSENNQIVQCKHTAVYLYIVEMFNKRQWVKKIGLPTDFTISALSISYKTYKGVLEDLVKFGFLNIEWSKNQYSSNQIELVKIPKAEPKHIPKLVESTYQSAYQSEFSIYKTYKHLNNKQINKILTYFNSIPISDIDLKIDEIIKEEKEDKPKKPRSVFTPPVISDVISYFEENGYTKQSAEKAFKYYSVANWKDSKGDQVKNWKQKMQGVWFKDENKETIIINETLDQKAYREHVEQARKMMS